MSSRKTAASRISERVAVEDRVLVVVAGSNGAGKTTFVETLLTIPALRVVNADAIARALSPTPEAVAYEAARLADDVRRDLLSRGISFCMETDNSSAEEPYRFVAELESGKVVRRGKTQPRWWRELRPTASH